MKCVLRLFLISGIMAVAFFSVITDAFTAMPVISNERVQLRTLANGDVVVNVSATVEDLDGIGGLRVTVERPGVFGPFPLQPGLYLSPGDTPTLDGFNVAIDSEFIPAAQRAGDYILTVDDGVDQVSTTVTLPSGLFALPAGAQINDIIVDTSTGLLRPTISIPAIAGASGYRISIVNDSDSTSQTFDGVAGADLSSVPSIRVGSGRLEAGRFYRLSIDVFDALQVALSDRRSESADICYDPATGRTDIPCITQKDVHIVTESNGETVMLTIGRVLDRDNLAFLKNPPPTDPPTVPVSLTRGNLGPFPLTSSILLNVDTDSDVTDQFASARNPLDMTQIPVNQRSGDYTFTAQDSTGNIVNVTRNFPSGVTPFPAPGPIEIDPSTGTLTPTISIPAIEPIPVPPGRVGWWRGDGDATDSQLGNNGTAINGTTFEQGLTGLGKRKAFSFPIGTDAYVSLGNPGDLQFSGDFTIAAWVKPSTNGNVDHIFSRRSAGCGTLELSNSAESQPTKC